MTTKIVVAFLATIFFIFAISLTASVQPAPTADSLGVEEATGKSGTHVEVPVKIVNVSNGPVQSIRLQIDYSESVLTLTGISSGDLTPNWGILQLGEDKHNMTIATFNTKDAIPDGSNGSVVLLKFHVIGSPGDTSPMNMVVIELSDPEGTVGTAQVVRTGTFTVESSNGGGSSGNGGTGGGGGGSRYTPTSTPTEKPPAVSEEEEEEKLTEPHSPTLAPNVTPSSAAPVQTNTSTTPELTAKANPIWVIVLIAVLIIAVIIYVVFKNRKK